MITKEFKYWVEGIRDFIEERLHKIDYIEVWMSTDNTRAISIYVSFGDIKFWMSFDQIEYDRNNKRQRRSLAKCRRQYLMREIEDLIKIATKVARALK